MTTVYITLALLWTFYMGLERYSMRPQSRPHFVGFLITNLLLFPIAFIISAFAGILNERIRLIVNHVKSQKEGWLRSGRKKLIG